MRRFIHDVRTHLNQIVIRCDLLMDDLADLENGELVWKVAKIRKATHHLNALCSGELAYSTDLDMRAGEWIPLELAVSGSLNQIIGYSDLLSAETDGPEFVSAHEDVVRISRAADEFWKKIQRSGLMITADSARPDSETEAPVPALHGRREGGQVLGRVLVVDDEAANRDVLARCLEREGYSVENADGANAALRIMRETPFDVVLLDVMMPGKDGFELLRDLRADPALRQQRVIMISALNSVDRIAACLQAGADDYLTKPFDPLLLRARMESSMERKHFRDAELAHIRQLHAERDQLAVTLESITDAVITADMQRRVTLMNSAAEALAGWPMAEALGADAGQILNLRTAAEGEPAEDIIGRVLEAGEACMMPKGTKLQTRTGKQISVWVRAAPLRTESGTTRGLVIVIQDMTDRERLEQEMLRMSKAESLGLLAGNIAHEFNNILTAVFGNLSLARLEALPERAVVCLDDVEASAARARDLTQRFLTFSRGGSPVRRLLRLEEILARSSSLASIPPKVRIDVQLAPNVPMVNADVDQIAQVFDNLFANAIQAMPGGGSIAFSAEPVMIEPGNDTLSAGEYVRITIRDSGEGIPSESLPLVFDPFFTTRANRSGLGLSAAYSIIRKHEGAIEVESAPGSGTAIQIHLPAILARSPAKPAARATVEGEARILIMDDEERIRKVVAELLSQEGYRVRTAANGEEALQIYSEAEQAGNPFDAVIVDLIVPNGMGGREMIRRLRDMGSETPAIVSSGYSDDPVMANHEAYGFDAVLAKPFKLSDLERSLGELLRKREKTATE